MFAPSARLLLETYLSGSLTLYCSDICRMLIDNVPLKMYTLTGETIDT